MRLQPSFHLFQLDKATLPGPGLAYSPAPRRILVVSGFFFFLLGGWKCFVVLVLFVVFFGFFFFICFSLPVRARPFVPDRMILGRVEAKGVCLFAPPAGWFPVTRGDNTVSRTVWEWEERQTQKMSSSPSCRSIRRPVHPLHGSVATGAGGEGALAVFGSDRALRERRRSRGHQV